MGVVDDDVDGAVAVAVVVDVVVAMAVVAVAVDDVLADCVAAAIDYDRCSCCCVRPGMMWSFHSCLLRLLLLLSRSLPLQLLWSLSLGDPLAMTKYVALSTCPWPWARHRLSPRCCDLNCTPHDADSGLGFAAFASGLPLRVRVPIVSLVRRRLCVHLGASIFTLLVGERALLQAHLSLFKHVWRLCCSACYGGDCACSLSSLGMGGRLATASRSSATFSPSLPSPSPPLPPG